MSGGMMLVFNVVDSKSFGSVSVKVALGGP